MLPCDVSLHMILDDDQQMTHYWSNELHQSGSMYHGRCCLNAQVTRLEPGINKLTNASATSGWVPATGSREHLGKIFWPMTRTSCADLTHLVNHVGQQALHFVVVNLFLAPEADRGGKLSDRHAAAADWLLPLLGLLKSPCDEYFPEEVAQRDVAAAFQCEVDAALDKLVLALLQSEIKFVELAPLDAPAERQEEFLQPRILGQKLLCRKGVASDEPARNEVCQNKPGSRRQRLA